MIHLTPEDLQAFNDQQSYAAEQIPKTSAAEDVSLAKAMAKEEDLCILHPERQSTAFLTVPCALTGKVGMCAECSIRHQNKDPRFLAESFRAYKAAQGQRIAQFKSS